MKYLIIYSFAAFLGILAGFSKGPFWPWGLLSFINHLFIFLISGFPKSSG
jgi:hypothetical protein